MAYLRLPLYGKILFGAAIGVLAGWSLGPRADALQPAADIVLQLLTLLATPLIFFGLFHALLTAEAKGRTAGRLLWLMVTNCVAASVIGLLVGNALFPPRLILRMEPYPKSDLPPPTNPLTTLLAHSPHDFISPFATNDVLGVVIIAIALAIALRLVCADPHPATAQAAIPTAAWNERSEGSLPATNARRVATIAGYAKLGLEAVILMLHWVFELIPLAVLAVVARIVGSTGLAGSGSLLAFVGAVCLGLAFTAAFYAARLRLTSRLRPVEFVRGAADALLLAFSTASSASTLPVTYECATAKLGVGEETASLGVMAGGTISHDGGALYQVMGALFISNLSGEPLTLANQGVLVGMAVLASFCTAGIPQAGLVSMVAVLHAVRLPVAWIPFLLPADWFLDRCRTAVNVAGNLVATCIVDRPK